MHRDFCSDLSGTQRAPCGSKAGRESQRQAQWTLPEPSAAGVAARMCQGRGSCRAGQRARWPLPPLAGQGDTLALSLFLHLQKSLQGGRGGGKGRTGNRKRGGRCGGRTGARREEGDHGGEGRTERRGAGLGGPQCEAATATAFPCSPPQPLLPRPGRDSPRSSHPVPPSTPRSPPAS